jgi:tetratricopeptide (TPR) repeat protein
MSETAPGNLGSPPVPVEPPTPRPGNPTGRRKWLFRLAAVTLVPALVLALLEGSLWLGGYGRSTDFFVDGSKIEKAEVWIDNPTFGRWVFPYGLDHVPTPLLFSLPKTKAKGTFRIFVLGESAAQGFPEPTTSFARVLEVLLRARYPDTEFEVLNASMVAINSHIVLPIARQCARQQPDLLVVHLGNNEVVGPFGATGVLGPVSPPLSVVRANLALKTTRTGQLLNHLIRGVGRKQPPRVWQGMAMFTGSEVPADDSRLPRIHANFRQNLQDICAAAASAGAPAIVCTIPVNLRDCAPFGSAHAADLDDEQTQAWERAYRAGVRLQREKKFAEAIRSYQEAGRIDDAFAELAYRLGHCCLARGKASEARGHFLRARDLDTLRFRTDSTLNETIRNVVAAASGARLADAERAFAEHSPHGLPGEELFLEHVHMNFRGNYLLARTVFEALTDLAPAGLGAPAEKAATLSEQECAERLGQTEWNEMEITRRMADMLANQPPFTAQLDHQERSQRMKEKVKALRKRLEDGGFKKAVAMYHKAVGARPDDWMLHLNFGSLLEELGALKQAEEQYLEALGRLRHCAAAHLRLGILKTRTRRSDEAIEHFREALRIQPDWDKARFGLADALADGGRNDEARAIYEEEARKSPNSSAVQLALGRFLLRTGDLDEAWQCFSRVLELEPGNPSVHVYLGDTALKQGKTTEAVAQYEKALQMQPDWPELRAHLARVRKKPGKATR